jgi:hypothetical protein
VTNQPYSCGDQCPWLGCSECAFRGWESDVAQADSRVSGARDVPDFGRLGGSKTAPGVASTNTEGLAQPKL